MSAPSPCECKHSSLSHTWIEGNVARIGPCHDCRCTDYFPEWHLYHGWLMHG